MNEQVKKDRMDLANKILTMISKGKISVWLQQWRAMDAPHNALSKANYRGINAARLSLAPHSDPRYMTYKQAQERGWQVRRGEKSTRVEKWTFFAREGTETDKPGDVTGVSVKYFNIFNAEQIDGVPAFVPNPGREETACAKADEIIRGCPVKISHGGGEAFYRPSEDSITVPLRESFLSDTAYYETLLHEMGHATGAEKRLNRDMAHRFGRPEYAFEELIAEFSSVFVSKECGLVSDSESYARHLENHASYIKGWQGRAYKPEQILEAISAGNKAANMVLGWGKVAA